MLSLPEAIRSSECRTNFATIREPISKTYQDFEVVEITGCSSLDKAR